MKRSITLAVILAILIAVPVLAQSGVSLESLSARVDSLFQGQAYLNSRINALETSVAVGQRQIVVVPTATPIPSSTPSFTPIPTSIPEPTETATMEPSATFTPTPPAEAKLRVEIRVQLRRGPGTNHAVVGTVEAGSVFTITGRNLNRNWWQVDHEGTLAWVQNQYVTTAYSHLAKVVATPTALPSPSPKPTNTPVPTATTEVLSQDEWEYMMEFTKRDTIGMGRNPDNYTDEQYDNWTSTLITTIKEAAKNCGMDFIELAKIIDEEALLLEETGIPKKLDAAARWDFARTLTEFWDETVESSCKRKVVGRRLWIVANYGDDE